MFLGVDSFSAGLSSVKSKVADFAVSTKGKVLSGAALTLVTVKESFAAVNTADVKTGIESAVSTAEVVGGYVIGAIAALVVVGLIIAIVKKM